MKRKLASITLELTLATLLIVVIFNITSCSNTEASAEKSSDEFVPQWSKNVVWYQIFPERFSNGDITNDPALSDVSLAFPFDNSGPWEVHPWGADWYKLQDYEKGNGKDIWHNLQRRRYGGDLQGIINKLDYIQDLGINAIYLNPVFASPSLHKYDAISLHHVEPTFGPNPAGDRKIMEDEVATDPSTWKWTSADLLVLELIEEVHKRGMYIIFDGVFNHMGYNSFAFQDVVKKQQRSVYKDWFTITSWENKETGTEFDYEGWFGHKSLPEFKEDSNGLNAGVSNYIYNVTERWMKPKVNGVEYRGIDGWRLDVAFCVHHNFWKQWRKHVKSINSEAYLTAEVVDSIKVVKEYLQGDEFDAIMNYNFAFISTNFFLETKQRHTPQSFDIALEELRNAYPKGVSYVQQNLFNSHDANRVSSHIVNAGIEDYGNWGKYFNTSMGSNPDYQVQKPDSLDYEIQKLMALFQMTYVGAPMIYYGDEVGMWGANDPDCRKPMIWEENDYEAEVYNPNQDKRSVSDLVEVNTDLLEHYKKLIDIRNSNRVLQLGTFENLTPDISMNTYVFQRTLENDEIVVFLNRGQDKEYVLVNVNGEYIDLLSGEKMVFEKAPSWVQVPSLSGKVLKKI